MAIAEDIKKLGEDIVASYDSRVKAIGTLVKDTHQMLKGFDAEHKEMAEKQAEALANFVADLTKSVGNMIKGFQKEHKEIADTLRADLAKGEDDRLKAFKPMMAGIQKEIKEIEAYVAKKLKEFDEAHADMSEELKKELAKYVDDMVKATKKLMSDIQARQKERNTQVGDLLEEFKTEREEMAANWQNMVATLAERRGVETEEEGEEKLGEGVEGGEAKPKKKKIVAEV